ncbi:transcriptional regulator family: Fungal Specific TF [Trichoderma harzianum]|nr:transcriptional regulator family: Fungal Specific TF [Trichoderma harzianum]
MATCIYPAFTKKPGPRKGYKRIAPTSDKSKDPLPPQETETLGSTLDDNGEWEESWSQNPPGQMSWSQSSFSGDTFHPLSSLDPTLEATALATTLESVPLQPPLSNSSREDSPLPSKTLIIHLLDVFFDYVHPQIRLLHQPSFVSRVESGSYALDEQATLILSSMFALAARYSDHPEIDLFDRMLLRRASDSYDSQDDIRYKSRKRWERGQGFLSQAYRLLMNETSRMDRLELESGEMQRPSITVVQAAAIVTFAQMGIGLSGRTYSLLSTTVQLAHDCGLDQVDYSDETIFTSRDSDSDPCKSIWVKKEELRRTWWVIAYLENFICVTKDRPRMIDWGKCRTKLPCDDKDWFQGRHCPSDFLPASLDDLRASLTVQPQLSVLAYRIRTMHLGAKMLEEAMNHDDALESNDILKKIQDVFAISNKIRCFKHATPSDIFNICRDLSRQRRQGNGNGTTPEAKAFSRALSASETVCSILRDSSADDVPRSCPYLASVLWVPTCLQLLVKLFTRADSELAERASLSLQILTMTLERFAEFSGLGQFVLSRLQRNVDVTEMYTDERHADSFRRYEKKLTDLQWADSKPGDDDHWIVSRILFFPDHINALSLKEVTSIDHSEGLVDPALALYQEPSAQFSIGGEFIQDATDSFDYITRDSNWILSEGFTEF